MKNKIMSTLFGMALLMVGACSQNNGQASANQHPDKNELNSLPIVEYIADSRGSYIQRFVDCEADVTLYIQSNGITAIPNSSVNQEFVKKHCKGNKKW